MRIETNIINLSSKTLYHFIALDKKGHAFFDDTYVFNGCENDLYLDFCKKAKSFKGVNK